MSSATIGSCETLAQRRDRVDELVEVVERLEHEEVGAAALEHRGLLGEQLVPPRASVVASPIGPIAPAMKTSRPEQLARLARELHAGELICSSSSSRKCVASLRRFAPNVFVSISSAPALMKLTCSETTASGARRFASSGERRRGTAAVMQRAHAAVGDERRALAQACLEASGHAERLDAFPPARLPHRSRRICGRSVVKQRGQPPKGG